MSDVKRYEALGYDWELVEIDDGYLVKFEDYEKRVNGQLKALEIAGRRIAELEEQVEFEMNAKLDAQNDRSFHAARIAELQTHIDNIMLENMNLNVKVVGFEQKIQSVLAELEGVE